MCTRPTVRVGSAFAVAALLLTLVAMAPIEPAGASAGQLGALQVVINPGGGTETDESDGIRFVLNGDYPVAGTTVFVDGSDQLRYRNQPQWAYSGSSPVLNIGGTPFGQAGAGRTIGSYNSLSVVEITGSARTDGSSGTGSGSATLRYTAIQSARTYTVDRRVSYTYPNNFVTEDYTVTIPDGNTDVVKLYLGGDASPGGFDSNGVGIMLTAPRRQVLSLNATEGVYSWFREVPDGTPLDGATSQTFNTPYNDVTAGNDIGFVADPANHDAGLMIQWTLGSTPGTQTVDLQQGASIQDVAISGAFASPDAAIDEIVGIDFDLINTKLIDATGAGAVITLPDDVTVATGTPTISCPAGSVTATVGSSEITLTGVTVTTLTNCVVSVPVSASAAGTYTLTRASASVSGGLRNGLVTTALTVPAQVPGPPTSLVATPGDEGASIEFIAPENNGSPITNYEYSTDDGATWTPQGLASTSTPIVLTDLENGSTYSVRLRALNDVGTGPQSASVSVTPIAPSDGGGPLPSDGGGSLPSPTMTTTTTTVPAPPLAVVARTAGVDRYATAAAFNADLRPGIEVAYIATGALFPDALAAGPVAGIEGAALLLVEPDAVPAATSVELTRLRPGRIVIIGGVAAVSSSVAADLVAFTVGTVERIAGADRYGTALALSRAAFPSEVDVVHLASGAGSTDAVSAGPAAGFEHGPVLLVNGRTLDEELRSELRRLATGTVVIGGGAGAVDAAIEMELAALLPGTEVVRAAGADRFATSVALAERVFSDRTEVVFVATGLDFADALGATPAAIRSGAAIVLVPLEGLVPDSVLDRLERLGDIQIMIAGGPAAVPDAIVAQLR